MKLYIWDVWSLSERFGAKRIFSSVPNAKVLIDCGSGVLAQAKIYPNKNA